MYEGIQVWGELTPLGATITQINIAPQRVIFAPPVLFLLEITYNAQLLFLVFRNVLTFHHGECSRAVPVRLFVKASTSPQCGSRPRGGVELIAAALI